jgi:hypothetical protein
MPGLSRFNFSALWKGAGGSSYLLGLGNAEGQSGRGARDPSLRLKNGYGRDDADRQRTSESG